MYRIFGYTDDCRDFNLTTDRFADVVKWFKKSAAGCVVFTNGISPGVCQRLRRYES